MLQLVQRVRPGALVNYTSPILIEGGDSVRKFLSISLSALVLMAMLFGCNTSANETAKIDARPKAPSINEQEPSTAIGVGGEFGWEFFSKLEPGYYGIDTFLKAYVGADNYTKWIAQFRSHDNPGGRDPAELTITNAVKELCVSKQDFIAGNRGVTYSPAQIDAIYSNDPKLINRAFVNRYALLHNDAVYTADWLASRSASCYAKESLTRESLFAYLKAIDYDEFNSEYLVIAGNIKKMTRNNALSTRRERLAPYVAAYYGIGAFVAGLVDDAKLSAWMDAFLFNHNENRRGRSITECTVANLVKELGIERAAFEKADTWQTYNKQQLDAIFSRDQKKIDEAFVSSSALLVNGNIYTAEWLLKHDIGQYRHEGITAAMLASYLSRNSEEDLAAVFRHVSSALTKMK